MVSEKLGAAFIEVGVDTGGLTTGLAGAKAQVMGFGASASSAFSDLAASINPATIAIAGATAGIMAVGAAFAGSVRAAAQWQTLMVDVQKVTDTTAAGFASLSKDLLAIRGETGASMESIAGAAAGAGRMGIDPDEIAGYTEVILKMSSAWGVSADASSDAIGKIGAAVKPAEMEWADFANRSGSLINDLADTTVTSEAAIIQGLSKLTGSMKDFKVQPEQLAGWASMVAYLQEMGDTAVGAGEHIKDALREITKTTHGEDIAALIGVDFGELQEMIRTDTIGTFEELAAAIADLPLEEQGDAFALFGDSGAEAMKKFAGGVDETTGSISRLGEIAATGKSAWENASSLNEQYAKSQENLNAQIDIFRGKISVAATSIGTVLLPYLTQMMEAVNDITQALIDLGTRGWQWLTGGAEGENVTERAAGKVRSWADSQGWLSGYLADYDAAKARDAGVDLGQDLTKGVAEGTEGVGPAIEGNLENVDGEGAGESVGKDFQTGFLAGTAKLGGMFTKQSMDSMHAAGMMYNYATGQYESRSGGGSGRQWGETFEAGGSTIGFAYKEGDQEPWILTIGDWTRVFGTPDQARAWISAHFLTLDDLISPEQWEIAWKSARQKTTGSYDDPGDVVKLKAKLEPEVEISPYDIWGTPQHWADYSAKYWGEIEDLTILELYNLEDHLRSEGAAGWERAWETILDPDATEAQITGALGVLSPVLEEMGYENGDSYLLGLRERVAESGAELADSIVDSGKYQEYKLEELGESWGAALKDSIIKVQEQETLLGIVAELEKAGYAGSEALKNAILAEDWEEVGRIVGEITGDGVVEGFGGIGERLSEEFMRATSALKSNEIFKMLWYGSPEEQAQAETWIRENVANQDVWFRKHLGDAASGWMKDAEEYGLRVDSSFWNTLETSWETHSDWFDDETRMFMEGVERRFGSIGGMVNAPFETQIKLLDVLANGYKKVDDATKAADDNLAKYTAEADCACEAMSSFGMAQEKMSDQLFNRSYIGPTSGYAAFLEEERARGAFHPEAQQLSMVYKVEADTEAAEKSVEDLKTDIDQSEAAPQIDAITQPAYDAVDSFLGWVNGISASVYVGAYGPGTEYMGGGDTGYLESLSPGITSSPGWGTSDWLPALAEGGIVSRPIIAQVGEVPEAITPLNVLFPAIQQAVAAAGGGGGVTINSTVIVQGGTVLDEDELQQVLNSRDDQLKNEIARKYLGR